MNILKSTFKIRAMAIDMETATIFSTAFYNEIPAGAIIVGI
jgi:AMP nucleosidase